jgi:hypothetical protein
MLGTKKNVLARETLSADHQIARQLSAPASLRAEIPEYARRPIRQGYIRVVCHRGDSLDMPRSMTLSEVMKRAADHMLNCPWELVTLHFPTSPIDERRAKYREPIVQASEPFGDTPFTTNCGVGRQYLYEQDPDRPHVPEVVWAPMKVSVNRRVSDLVQPCGMNEQKRVQRCIEVSANAPLDHLIGMQIPPDVKYLLATASEMNPMTVYVRTYAHRTVTLHNTVMVSDVKRGLYRALGIGPERQKLFFGGCALQDDYSLTEEGVVHGDVIHLADPLKELRYYMFEKAQSRRPVGVTYPKFPPRQGPAPHDLSVGVTNWIGFEQWKGHLGSMATVHDREWTMNLSRDDLWPSSGARGDTRGAYQRDKTWLNSTNAY